MDYAKHNYGASNIYYIPVDLETETKLLDNRNISKIICFETLEHTTVPFEIISEFYNILPEKGEVILSFPNKTYEKFDENGNNQDPHHLSVIDLKEFLEYVSRLGFKVKNILGQTLMNEMVDKMSYMQEKYHQSFDELYQYDMESIVYFSRKFAYPDNSDVNHSYSFTIHLQK